MTNDCALHPAFAIYVVTAAVLIANMMFLWGYSGAVRAKTKRAINEEDAAQFKTEFDPVVPPAVARVLRAHANAQASIVPFLILGALFVALNGSATTAKIIFGVFVAARLGHSFAYLAKIQPWRTILFVVSALSMLALMGNVLVLTFGCCGH